LTEAVDDIKDELELFDNVTKSHSQLDELAVLLGVDDRETAWNLVFDVNTASNIILEVYSSLQEYLDKKDVESATKFVDKYDWLLDSDTLERFMPNIDNDYKSAKELLKPESSLEINLFEDSEKQEFIMGIDKNLIFILDTDDRVYGKVLVDDKELSEENGYYKWGFSEGTYPTIILSEDYMKTLKVGKYTIKFILDDGRNVETTFTIVEEDDDIDDSNNNLDKENENSSNNSQTEDDSSSNLDKGNENSSNNPQTGDDIVLFTVISLIAVVGLTIVIKVKKYVKE